MNKMDYGRSVVTIRVLEKKLFTQSRLNRMIDVETPEEVLKILGETEYSQNMSEIANLQEYELILKRETERVFNLVRELSNDTKIVDVLSLKYDYHNLKVLFKSKFLDIDMSNLLMNAGILDIDKLKVKFELKNYFDLADEFVSAIKEVEKNFSENHNPQMIDIIIDKYYYKHLSRIAKQIDSKLINNYVSGIIDFQNIITLFRVKKQNKDINFLEKVVYEGGNINREKIIDSLNDTSDTILSKFKREKISSYLVNGIESYSESNKLSDLEKNRDNFLLSLTEDSKYILFGPEPLFTYLLVKENEINSIRVIMVGKLNNINTKEIRERLRDTYA